MRRLIVCFLIVFVAVVFTFSCSKPVEISRVSLGKIISASVVPTSFNEVIKLQVTTEKCFIVIWRALPSIRIGAEAFQVNYDNGQSYFTWEGSGYMYTMSGWR